MANIKEELKGLNDILHRVKLETVMSKPVTTVEMNDDFSRVEEVFVNNSIRHLPVVNEKRELVGIISQKDVYRHIAPRRNPEGQIVYRKDIIVDDDGYYEKDSLNQYILKHVMRKNVKVLTRERTLGDAIHLMVSERLSCVPIVDAKKHVIGIITRVDVLKLADSLYHD